MSRLVASGSLVIRTRHAHAVTVPRSSGTIGRCAEARHRRARRRAARMSDPTPAKVRTLDIEG